MATLNTAIRGAQIATAVAANGLKKDGSDNLAIEPNDFAGIGVEDDGSDNLRLSTQGNGITGGSGTVLAVNADSTGGANLATVINVSANGVAVSIDDSTIGENISNQLEVKDGAITNAKVNASAAIAYSKLNLTGNILNADINASAAIAFSKLAALTDGNILVGNGTNVVTSVAMSGDATIVNSGAITIANDAVSNAKLANMTQGTVKVGGAASAPTDLDAKTDGYILVGDGTDVNSVAVSGDVTLSNSGATTVTDLTISSEAAGDLLYFNGSNWVRLADSASANYVLTSDAAGGLSWTAKTAVGEEVITESEINLEDESANCNGATTAFTISNAAVVNSVQVFLNGLLQQAGSGKDYTYSGTTVTFATAPATGDILLIHYMAT